MSKEDRIHLAISIILAGTSILSLVYFLPAYISSASAIGLIVYVFILLLECASKSEHEGTNSSTKILIELPHETWALFLVQLLILTNVFSFANLYLESGEVINSLASSDEQIFYLSSRIDALYYSFVTLTTLGYGDFFPSGAVSRLLVVLQLFSGALLLLFIVPVLGSRISAWK